MVKPARKKLEIANGRPSRYDWDAWTDGRQYEAREGVDYESASAFVSSAHSAARARGLRVRTIQGVGAVQFYFEKIVTDSTAT